jgi:hypothetical protein
MVRRFLVVLAVVSACYSAKPDTGSPCGPGEPCPTGQSCSVVTQTCEITGGELSVDHTTLDFTMVPCGGSSTSTLALHNAGSQPITFDITSDVPGVTVAPATGTVAAGEQVTISVTAAADAIGTPGVPMTGQLSIQTSDPTVPPISVPVTLSTVGGILSTDQSTLDFGQVTMSTPHTQTVNLSNAGNSMIAIAAGPFSDPAFTVTSAAMFSLAPGASHAVDIQFDPPATQSYGYQLPLQVTGPTCQPTPLVQVTGVGSLDAVLLDHTTLDFGSVACGSGSAMKTLTISNSNASSYPYTASVTTGGTKFSVAPTSGTVVASGTTPIVVTRAGVSIPTATGMVSGNLHVVVTGPPNGTNDVALKYDITGADLSASTTSLDFPDVDVNSSRSKTVTITNNGNQTANITVTRSGSSEMSGPSTFQVAAGAMVAMMITFHPTAVGTVTADFALSAPNQCSSAIVIHVSGTSGN